MKRMVLGGTKVDNNFGFESEGNLRQRLWICQSRDSGLIEKILGEALSGLVLGLLVDFQPHDPARAIQFQSSLALKDRVSVHAGNGDKNFFIDQCGGVGAVEVFQ